MKIAVVGATGFVGSAVHSYLLSQGEAVTGVGRANYETAKDEKFDLIINASNNSKKYISDREPMMDFDLSVHQQMRVLHDFPSPLHVLLSSVDVYSELDSYEHTTEGFQPDIATASHYGFHKYLAEQCVRHYAPDWLIIRLAGMVGPNLKKNPVFDILHDQPLRIHPSSEYQFMHTADVAAIVYRLIQAGKHREIVNVCGKGLITPQRIAELAGKSLNLSELPNDASPRNVRINIKKLSGLMEVPASEDAVRRYLSEIQA